MGDVGVLNYAYALEQLEADFYTKVVNNFYAGISNAGKRSINRFIPSRGNFTEISLRRQLQEQQLMFYRHLNFNIRM